MPTKSQSKPQSQIDKFKQAAREVETDDREAAFDEKLRKVAKVTPAKTLKPSRP